jgi:uncharacterized protein (DUF1778 family)
VVEEIRAMGNAIKRREDRLEVRLSSTAKNLLKLAASAEHKTVSAFVLESGLAAATEALADRREFALTAKQYQAFSAALDTPMKPKRRLEKLLKTTSVLE